MTYPFTAVVGQDEARLALLLCAVNPRVLRRRTHPGVRGDRGVVGDLFDGALDVSVGVLEFLDGARIGLWERVARRYALDPAMQEWFRQVNPHALHNIVDKLLDAAHDVGGGVPADEDIEYCG
jgi:cobaltochelatase CobN